MSRPDYERFYSTKIPLKGCESSSVWNVPFIVWAQIQNEYFRGVCWLLIQKVVCNNLRYAEILVCSQSCCLKKLRWMMSKNLHCINSASSSSTTEITLTHYRCWLGFLSKKYLRQISILGTGNLCQKLLFLHQLTHNMTTDCSWKL